MAWIFGMLKRRGHPPPPPTLGACGQAVPDVAFLPQPAFAGRGRAAVTTIRGGLSDGSFGRNHPAEGACRAGSESQSSASNRISAAGQGGRGRAGRALRLLRPVASRRWPRLPNTEHSGLSDCPDDPPGRPFRHCRVRPAAGCRRAAPSLSQAKRSPTGSRGGSPRVSAGRARACLSA